MAGTLITIDQIDNFKEVRGIPPEQISKELLHSVQNLNEKEELEPFVRSILFDSSDTPHGPAELVDILTHKISVDSKSGLAAFILKGKSFPKVRPKHVAHQIYRLEKIAGVQYTVFAASGTILDEAKEQFCSTSERLNVKYAIFDAVDLARLFVAHGFLCPRDARKISAGRCQCGYSPKKRILNIFQKESLKELKDAHSIGQESGIIVLPPGSGKTRIAAEDAKAIGAKRILYVAHTHEILDVAQSEFEAAFGRKNVLRCMDRGSLNNLKSANILTIQLLSKNLTAIPSNYFDFVVLDEFHHAAAKTYRQLIEHVGRTFLLGLTATPFRSDRQDIIEICNGNVLVNFELRSGIEAGILTPYHYYGCFDDVDYSKITLKGTRYSIKDLEKALVIPERDHAIIDKWAELALEKPTLAFCCSHNHAKRVANNFNSKGIPTEIYLSFTDLKDRKKIIENLQHGKLKVICTVDVLNEGADLPFIECLLFLRPTESKRVFYQQLGRGLRKYAGKSHCIVIDFIGNFQNAYRIVEYHGLLPFADEESSMSFRDIRNAKEILNLPIGCEVHFDDRVIDIFAKQTLDPRYATRHNIGRILLYQYKRFEKKLGRKPKKIEIDRNFLLDSRLYVLVFGSWRAFERIVSEE
jgi:superfamily II DNA or RNA helicase